MPAYTPQRSAEAQSSEARARAKRAKEAAARKASLAALARLGSIEDEWTRNPGAAPNGTGRTGLAPNDAKGYSDMLNRQTEGLNLQRELAGQRPMDIEGGGEFDDEPEPDRFEAAQQRAAETRAREQRQRQAPEPRRGGGGSSGGALSASQRAPAPKPAGAKYDVEIELPGSEAWPERIDVAEERAYRAQLKAAEARATQEGRMADPDYRRAEQARQDQTDLSEFGRNAPKKAGLDRQITIDDIRALAPEKRKIASDDAGAQVNDPQLRGLSDLLFGRQKELENIRGDARRSNPTPKPATAVERQTLAFYNRAKSASEDIEPFEDGVSKGGIFRDAQMKYAHNALQTKEQQQYTQAQRAFTEARLRKESGAAISTSEYSNDAAAYFAQPGDSKEVMAQKRQGRQKILDGLKYGAGKAYGEFYGDDDEDDPRDTRDPKKLGPNGEKLGDRKTFKSGKVGEWDGEGWRQVS